MTDHDTLALDLAKVSGGTPADLAAIRGRYHSRMQRARDDLAAIDACIVEHIEANGGAPIRVSDSLELRAVQDKSTSCPDKAITTLTLLAAVDGDLQRFSECLAAGAFKPGACKGVLDPGVYSRLFETTVKTRLETGKPVKRLAVVNPLLLPQGATYERD